MKQIVILVWISLLTMTASAQQFKWPPQSYPLSVPFKVSEEVGCYWGIQRISCLGKGNGGYKFRISGVAKHDFNSSHTIDMFYIAPGNRLTIAGAYSFPKISKGQKFSFDIVSAFSGYVPVGFRGFFIHDKWLSVPEEEVETASPSIEKKNEDIIFTASAPEAVELNSPFRVNFTVNSEDAKDFRGPDFEGFEVLMGPSRSSISSTNIVNGNTTTTKTISFTYVLLANKLGEYTIQKATITAHGMPISSNRLQIKVLPENQMKKNVGEILNAEDLFVTTTFSTRYLYVSPLQKVVL